MKTLRRTLSLLLACAVIAPAVAEDEAKKASEETVFHKPFTLKLHVDQEHFYEEKFDKIPFVHKDSVYLFKDDEFGLKLDIQEGAIRAVKYEPDVKKADVTLKFTQQVGDDGSTMMMLRIQNTTKHAVDMDALMTVPGRKGIAKTNILTLMPGLSGYESWPHPIVQLVLRNLRVGK